MEREEARHILDRRTTIPGDGYSFEQINLAIDMAISALTPPTQEQLERVWGAEWIECEEYDKCSKCGYLASKFWRGDFCPGCNRAMTPEALKIVRERWSAVIEGGV